MSGQCLGTPDCFNVSRGSYSVGLVDQFFSVRFESKCQLLHLEVRAYSIAFPRRLIKKDYFLICSRQEAHERLT